MKKKKMNNKLVIVLSVVFLLVIATVITVVIVKNLNSKPNNNNGSILDSNITVTGKLAEYVRDLDNNYYIKYSGKFKNSAGESVNAIVEYTKEGEKYALRANTLDIHLICEGEKIYSISHTYKMIVEMNKQSFDISEYNLASDMNQTYVGTYKENINNIEYDVEEYTLNGNTIKYYFKEKDIKLIRYNSEDIKILRVDKKTNTELFVKPKGYSNI